jgi:hypothetical protein
LEREYAATLNQIAWNSRENERFLTNQIKAANEEVDRLEALLRTQIVNNEEILQAAREGKIKRAKELREKLIKKGEAK